MVGEIAVRGGIVMKGYYNRPDATAAVMDDGWLLTGDLGRLDEHNNVFITGRAKDIIVLASGKNIYPEEIEAHYLRSPFIKEIAVIGLEGKPGEPISERLHGVIVPNFEVLRERKIVNAKEMIRFEIEGLSSQLPATKRILSYDIWQEDLPRTTTRKVKRNEVEKRVRAMQGRSADTSESTGTLSAQDKEWMGIPEVQRALMVLRDASNNKRERILPSDNLELDLGLDSMERVELLVALERELNSHVPDSIVSEVYTVRELVDAVARASALRVLAREMSPPGERYCRPIRLNPTFSLSPKNVQFDCSAGTASESSSTSSVASLFACRSPESRSCPIRARTSSPRITRPILMRLSS